jgi:hypothetical protein
VILETVEDCKIVNTLHKFVVNTYKESGCDITDDLNYVFGGNIHIIVDTVKFEKVSSKLLEYCDCSSYKEMDFYQELGDGFLFGAAVTNSGGESYYVSYSIHDPR